MPSGEDFEARDQSSNLSSAAGRAAIAHAAVGLRLQQAIEGLTSSNSQPAPPRAEENSLREKISLLIGVIAKMRERVRLDVGDVDSHELASELGQLLLAADALYQRTLNENMRWLELSAEDGVVEAPNDLPARLMDVADYLTYADCQLEEILLVQDSVH